VNDYTEQDALLALDRLRDHTNFVEHRQLVHPHNDVENLAAYMAGMKKRLDKLEADRAERPRRYSHVNAENKELKAELERWRDTWKPDLLTGKVSVDKREWERVMRLANGSVEE
jgi:chromosome segregation ATPase